MATTPQTLRDVFPDAPVNSPIVVSAPPDTIVHARRWSRISTGLSMLGLVAGFIVYGMFKVDYYGPAFFILILAAAVLFTIALIVYVIGHSRMKIVDVPTTMVDWREYAAVRGLQPVGTEFLDGIDIELFTTGHSRAFSGLHQGRVGDVEMVIGATSWVTGGGDDKDYHEMAFALARLPDEVAALLPGCSLTRYLRSLTGHDVDLDDGRDLRLESVIFDNCCNVQVHEHSPDAVWLELFDPITVDALVREVDIQWLQQRETIAFIVDTGDINRVHVELMDTLCHGGSWVCGRYRAAASGDVARELLRAQ